MNAPAKPMALSIRADTAGEPQMADRRCGSGEPTVPDTVRSTP